MIRAAVDVLPVGLIILGPLAVMFYRHTYQEGAVAMEAKLGIGNLGDCWEVALTNGRDRWVTIRDGFPTRDAATAWAAALAGDCGLNLARASIIAGDPTR